MIYLDNGATTLRKPPQVLRAVSRAMTAANPGRGAYGPAMAAANHLFACRQAAGELFHCAPERVVLTSNCTHALNIAIRSLVPPGGRAIVSGFEHNAVTRPLYALDAQVRVAGRRLFSWENTLAEFEEALKEGADAAIFTHVSNVFGYILPVEELAALCRRYGVPFVLDAAQSAGSLPIDMEALGAAFIAMPGHKGLLGPQGTGLLLCARPGTPLLYGGTGSQSLLPAMPEDLPERLEAGTQNTPGAAGLEAGIRHILKVGAHNILRREHAQLAPCIRGLEALGYTVYHGPHQAATLSFQGARDCQELASALAARGVAVRAGLHCAPLAHRSAGTLERGTVRVSFGPDASPAQTRALLSALADSL